MLADIINTNSKMLKLEEIKLGGYFMIEGLEYHYSNYLNLSKTLITLDYSRENSSGITNFKNIEKNRPVVNKMKHEAIAYLNRMGQFYYFATSKTFQSKIKETEKYIPNVVKFV